MANTSAVCTSFKVELLEGKHNFTASTGDTFKIALYTSSATLGASTTDYATGNEITNTSGTAYTAGGKALTSVTPTSSGTTAYCDFSDVSWTSASFTANACLIYNTTTGTGSGTTDAVCAVAFGGDKTVSSGTFTIQFPTADASDAILRIA
tara:strand:- start:270 stop:722 length:453 start_codon:yes stop_codon:yes gene_type:complete